MDKTTQTNPLPTEADLKKIVGRMSKRAPQIADAEAQVECAKVALRNLKAKLDKLLAEQDADESLIKIWSAAMPDRFEAAPKGVVALGKATVTLRNCPASIKNLDGYEDDDVIAACEKHGKPEYIRVKKSLDRAAVKADWNAQRVTEKELKKLGLCACCDAEFKVKLKD